MTGYLLDTNVLSELVGANPDANVREFVTAIRTADLATSAISRFEIERGLALMPAGRRRELYERRYRALIDGLGGGVLPLDDRAASAAARISVEARARGTSLDDHLFDVLIAGTAEAHGLTVVSRNERQFRAAKVPLTNPWGYHEG